MPHYRPTMKPADKSEAVIDLESSGIIDLEHARVCGGSADAATAPQSIEVVERHANPRCSTSDREILRSPFTDV